MWLDSISQRFGYNFVNDITEANRSKVLRDDRVGFFWMRVMKV
jgi:hypothetical protein